MDIQTLDFIATGVNTGKIELAVRIAARQGRHFITYAEIRDLLFLPTWDGQQTAELNDEVEAEIKCQVDAVNELRRNRRKIYKPLDSHLRQKEDQPERRKVALKYFRRLARENGIKRIPNELDYHTEGIFFELQPIDRPEFKVIKPSGWQGKHLNVIAARLDEGAIRVSMLQLKYTPRGYVFVDEFVIA
jgi:hypothetical protein